MRKACCIVSLHTRGRFVLDVRYQEGHQEETPSRIQSQIHQKTRTEILRCDPLGSKDRVAAHSQRQKSRLAFSLDMPWEGDYLRFAVALRNSSAARRYTGFENRTSGIRVSRPSSHADSESHPGLSARFCLFASKLIVQRFVMATSAVLNVRFCSGSEYESICGLHRGERMLVEKCIAIALLAINDIDVDTSLLAITREAIVRWFDINFPTSAQHRGSSTLQRTSPCTPCDDSPRTLCLIRQQLVLQNLRGQCTETPHE